MKNICLYQNEPGRLLQVFYASLVWIGAIFFSENLNVCFEKTDLKSVVEAYSSYDVSVGLFV